MDRVRHRNAFITIAIATAVVLLAAAFSPYFPDPRAGDAPWIPDRRLVALQDVAWLTAVATAVWLSVVESIEHTGRHPVRRWAALGAGGGLAAGLAFGALIWWQERPRILAPGESGLVVRRGELLRALGPWPINQVAQETALVAAGDPGYLVVAPALAWALIGGGLGCLAMTGRAAVVRVQPNDR